SRLDAVGSLRPEGRVSGGRDADHLLGVRRTGRGERPVLHHPPESRGQRALAGRDAVFARGAVRSARRAVHRRAPGAGVCRRRRARQAEALMLLGPSLAVSAVLFALGVAGVLLRRNAIVIFMCVELMLNAVNLTFVALAQQLGVAGQIFVFFVMAVAAAEAG